MEPEWEEWKEGRRKLRKTRREKEGEGGEDNKGEREGLLRLGAWGRVEEFRRESEPLSSHIRG